MGNGLDSIMLTGEPHSEVPSTARATHRGQQGQRLFLAPKPPTQQGPAQPLWLSLWGPQMRQRGQVPPLESWASAPKQNRPHGGTDMTEYISEATDVCGWVVGDSERSQLTLGLEG